MNWLKKSIHYLFYCDKQKKEVTSFKTGDSDFWKDFWNKELKKLRTEENNWKNYCIIMVATALDIPEDKIGLEYSEKDNKFWIIISKKLDLKKAVTLYDTLGIFHIICDEYPEIVENEDELTIKVIP